MSKVYNTYNVKATATAIFDDSPDKEIELRDVDAENPIQAAATAQFLTGGEYSLSNIRVQVSVVRQMPPMESGQ